MKNTNLKRVLSLILSISIFLCCNMGTIKVNAKEVQNAEEVQEKTAIGGQDVVNFAMSLLGKPYKENGTTPEGFDLGGFTMYVYSNSVGINIDSKEVCWQKNEGISVNYEDIKLGDLVFSDDGSSDGIVGIYVGNDEYIYASEKGVIIEKISKFQCARRIIDDEDQQVLKVNKGETYEIKNTSNENMYFLTDNINANVEAQNCSSLHTIRILSNNEWKRVIKSNTVKFTVLEEDGINIYYPKRLQNNIKKSNTPIFYTAIVEPGKSYELVNDSEYEFENFFNLEGDFTYVYSNTEKIRSRRMSTFSISCFYRNDKVKFCKCNGESIKFKIPYELKDTFKEVNTPVLKKIVINKDEVLELNINIDQYMNYFTSATNKNGIRYSQVYRGMCPIQYWGLNYNDYGSGGFYGNTKIQMESGEKLEIILPYDFYGYKIIKKEPIYYELEILPGEVYEFKNLYQNPKGRLALLIDSGVNLEAIQFDYWGFEFSSYVHENKLYVAGGNVAEFTTRRKKSVKIYLPIEFKDLISKVDRPLSKRYGYERQDINKDKRVDAIDLSIIASNYNTSESIEDERGIPHYNYLFDERCDLEKDAIIDLYDLVTVAKKF